MLKWHSLPYDPAKQLVAGTYLAAAFVEGHSKRFGIYERRTRSWSPTDKRYYPSVVYDVKDADTSTDDDIRTGKLPKTVFTADDYAECVAWMEVR